MCCGCLAKPAAKTWASSVPNPKFATDGENGFAEEVALNPEAYFPVNTALRFSMKACTASR
jgi:hypothetical protein